MINGSTYRTKRWITFAKLAAAIPLIQFGGCTLDDLQLALLNGVAQSITTDVFSAAQTVLLNVFRV